MEYDNTPERNQAMYDNIRQAFLAAARAHLLNSDCAASQGE
jgi:hypothetical protein